MKHTVLTRVAPAILASCATTAYKVEKGQADYLSDEVHRQSSVLASADTAEYRGE